MPEARLKGSWTGFLLLCDFQMLNAFQTEGPKFSFGPGSCKCHSQALSQISYMSQGFFELMSYGLTVIWLFGFKLGMRWIRYMISNSGYILSLPSETWRPSAKAENFLVLEQSCNHKWLNVVFVLSYAPLPTAKSFRKWCQALKEQWSREGDV